MLHYLRHALHETPSYWIIDRPAIHAIRPLLNEETNGGLEIQTLLRNLVIPVLEGTTSTCIHIVGKRHLARRSNQVIPMVESVEGCLM